MDNEILERLALATDLIRQFGFDSLQPMLRACEALSRENAIDVAVLGQFKSGKSSLINALIEHHVLPIGALPVTAVVTRLVAGSAGGVQVTNLDGSAEKVAFSRLADFVTEAGNPGNRRRVAVVDVFDAALRFWPNIRLVDTPGLGSIWAHNTAASQRWMPNVGAAIVVVSSERPLSEEDMRLISDARKTAPRVTVVVTKIDLLPENERQDVIDFIERALDERFHEALPIFPFSNRSESKKWARQLREAVLQPLSNNLENERRATLAHKLAAVGDACREYLTLGVQAAEKTKADRNRLRAAVLNEKVSDAVIRDELQLAEQQINARTRPALEERLLAGLGDAQNSVQRALAEEITSWKGNLAQQAKHYEHWLKSRLSFDLTPFVDEAGAEAVQLVKTAEERFQRIVEAFRDRLSRNIQESMDISIPSVDWDPAQPGLSAIPIAVGQTFMTNWDLLWWMLPMRIVGRLFRRHVLSRAAREVEENVRRLVSDWAQSVRTAVADLRLQATSWVEAELRTLESLLSDEPRDLEALQDGLQRAAQVFPPVASVRPEVG